MRRALLILFLVTTTACVPPTALEILASAPREAAGEHAVRLVPNPCSRHGELLAPVEIAGQPAWLLVDSGAYQHVLMPSLVRSAGLHSSPESVLVGHGSGISARVLEPASFSVFELGAYPAFSFLSFEIWDPGQCDGAIGGVLAPGLLARGDGAVMLDLAESRLALLPQEAAAAELAARAGTGFVAARLEHESYVVNADVAGQKVRLLVDTGACCSYLHLAKGVELGLVSEAIDDGPRDIQRVVATHVSRGVALRAGELERTLDLHLLPRSTGPEDDDGALGMDVLKRCMIVIAAGEMRVRCPS